MSACENVVAVVVVVVVVVVDVVASKVLLLSPPIFWIELVFESDIARRSASVRI